MKFVRYEVFVQILGMFGVIASLLFVGFEIKQSRDIAIADIYQQRTSMALDIALNRYSPEQVAEVTNMLIDDPQKMTRQDVQLLSDIMAANFIYYENLHFQYQLGMIGEEEWNASKKLISVGFLLAPCSPVWWGQVKETWRESFASEVDSLLLQLEMAPCTVPVWQQEQP
jgi:hypothetical protein